MNLSCHFEDEKGILTADRPARGMERNNRCAGTGLNACRCRHMGQADDWNLSSFLWMRLAFRIVWDYTVFRKRRKHRT